MSKNEIQIFEYDGEDYRPVMNFEQWRVAFLNYSEKQAESNVYQIERHLKTDEVFVLLQGTATLIIGEDLARVPMEYNKVYNVPKGVWHCVFMSKDAKILIIENDNTSVENGEYKTIVR